MTKDKAKDYCETQISGLANKSNNADWSVRAKARSYHADKAQSRHDLSGDGCAKDLKATETYPSQVRKFEGKGLGSDG